MSELKIGSPITTNTQAQTNSKAVTKQKDNTPVFTFSGDRNDNGVVDFDDFADKDEAKLFIDKGLIGKSWAYVREYIGKLFDIKSAKVVIPENARDITSHYEININENKQVTTLNRIIDKDTNDRRSYENGTYSYDENGNIESFNVKHNYGYGERNKKFIIYKNEYDEQNHLKTRTIDTANSGGALEAEVLYFDNDGNLTGKDTCLYGDSSQEHFGGREYSHTEYSKDKDGNYITYSDTRKAGTKEVKNTRSDMYDVQNYSKTSVHSNENSNEPNVNNDIYVDYKKYQIAKGQEWSVTSEEEDGIVSDGTFTGRTTDRTFIGRTDDETFTGRTADRTYTDRTFTGRTDDKTFTGRTADRTYTDETFTRPTNYRK